MTTSTSNGLAFTTSAKTRKVIPFTLDGEEYHFTPSKIAGIVLPVMADGSELEVFKGMFDWIGNGLPDEEEARLEERLKDPDDDLDVPDLVEVFQGLVAAMAGRPTPASSGS
jgi:hypothetical protein